MSSFPTCHVCHQQFSRKGPAPFLLPCLHAVCETCVTSAAGGVISCSTCQRDVNLTETRLQKDVITEKEILHLTVQHQPELVLCTYEEDGNQAVCWCKECEDFLCENCQMIHGRPKITRHHLVEDIGDLQPGNFDVDEYCKTHPKSVLDTWDEKCCILICAKCKLGDHAEHKTVDFDEAVATARKEVANFGKEVQSSVAQQGTNLATIATDLQASDETCDNLTEKISHTFNNLKTLIDQREKELQIELKQHKDEVRRELNEKKNTSEDCQKKCQTTSDYISKTLKYSSRHDIISLRHILQSETRESISSAEALVHESLPLPRFNTDGLEKIKSVLAEFGALASKDDTSAVKQIKDMCTQTEDWVSAECENLKRELVQVKTSDEKEIQSLKKILIRYEKENGLYRLREDVADSAYLLKCTRVEFSRTRYNAEYVQINKEGELIRKAETNPPHSDQRLKNYRGTSSNVPLQQCGSPQYFEVKTRLEINKVLGKGILVQEIGLTIEERQDQSTFIAEGHQSYSLLVMHCRTHMSICRGVYRRGEHIHCLSDTLENTPGTSATLHFGVIYDSVRSRIAFLDVKNEKIIGKIDNVDSSVPLWPMFGVYNPTWSTCCMSLVVGSDIYMTESKKSMILVSLS